MLFYILPKWALAAIVIGVILFSIVAEFLIQRKEKQSFSEFGIRRRASDAMIKYFSIHRSTSDTVIKHPVGTMLHETMLW